jgi:hypothetical protein
MNPYSESECANPEKRADWTEEHNEHLQQLVDKYHGRHWKAISKEMLVKFPETNLSDKKCREHWTGCINPDTCKEPLTDLEKLFLVIYHQVYHNKWSQIAKKIPSRDPGVLKNNFYSMLRTTLGKASMDITTDVSGMAFLKTIYICHLIFQMLKKPSSQCFKRGAIPKHIYDLVSEMKITAKTCEKYTLHLRSVLVKAKKKRKALSQLEKYETLEELFNFFASCAHELTETLKLNKASQDISKSQGELEEIIFDAIEETLRKEIVSSSKCENLIELC